MRNVQHKQEAYFFYQFLSNFYDNWVNPFFWTPEMRDKALSLAKLDEPGLEVVDVGAGTGFTTEGVARYVAPERITALDQSPHQLSHARVKPALKGVQFVLGDAEDLPFDTDRFHRYVSAGSIEYWPEPQRALCEAYRVLKPGGIAVVIGPLRPEGALARKVADTWMLFPEETMYRSLFEQAGFVDLSTVTFAPTWVKRERYGIAIAGRKPAPGGSPLQLPPTKSERIDAPKTMARRIELARRVLVGSAAGFAFIPPAVALTAVDKARKLFSGQA